MPITFEQPDPMGYSALAGVPGQVAQGNLDRQYLMQMTQMGLSAGQHAAALSQQAGLANASMGQQNANRSTQAALAGNRQMDAQNQAQLQAGLMGVQGQQQQALQQQRIQGQQQLMQTEWTHQDEVGRQNLLNGRTSIQNDPSLDDEQKRVATAEYDQRLSVAENRRQFWMNQQKQQQIKAAGESGAIAAAVKNGDLASLAKFASSRLIPLTDQGGELIMDPQTGKQARGWIDEKGGLHSVNELFGGKGGLGAVPQYDDFGRSMGGGRARATGAATGGAGDKTTAEGIGKLWDQAANRLKTKDADMNDVPASDAAIGARVNSVLAFKKNLVQQERAQGASDALDHYTADPLFDPNKLPPAQKKGAYYALQVESTQPVPKDAVTALQQGGHILAMFPDKTTRPAIYQQRVNALDKIVNPQNYNQKSPSDTGGYNRNLASGSALEAASRRLRPFTREETPAGVADLPSWVDQFRQSKMLNLPPADMQKYVNIRNYALKDAIAKNDISAQQSIEAWFLLHTRAPTGRTNLPTNSFVQPGMKYLKLYGVKPTDNVPGNPGPSGF